MCSIWMWLFNLFCNQTICYILCSSSLFCQNSPDPMGRGPLYVPSGSGMLELVLLNLGWCLRSKDQSCSCISHRCSIGFPSGEFWKPLCALGSCLMSWSWAGLWSGVSCWDRLLALSATFVFLVLYSIINANVKTQSFPEAPTKKKIK